MDGFCDRHDAGRKLAAKLRSFASERTIVVALPRGGVPVGSEVARVLGAPLDVCVVRKVRVPWHPELGAGAVAEDGFLYLNPDVLEHDWLSEEELADAIETKRREVVQRVTKYRRASARASLRDRTVIIVDDGIATGGTARAAIRAIRAQHPASIVLAVPVAAPQPLGTLASEVDHLVCLRTPADLHAISTWYLDFNPVSDEEVTRILNRARRERTDGERSLVAHR